MKEKVHRFIWLFMAILFITTALGVGVYSFWVNTHNSSGGQADNYIKCPAAAITAKQEKVGGKLQGAKLAGFTPLKHVDYLKCQDIKVGKGAQVTPSSTITAIYTGALAANGQIFESSEDSGAPLTQPLSGLIPGWISGIPGMRVGGQRRLYIPAQYAYGPQASAKIPADSDLIFDITLLAVK